MLKAEMKSAPTLEAKLNGIGESNRTLVANMSGTRIIGQDGKDGKSAYEIALDNGFEGTESEWLESLHGKDGKDGENGNDYVLTESDKKEIAEQVATLIGSDVLIAIQNTTTAQEVMDAINAGKVVMARSGNTYYLLSNYDSSLIRFSRAYQSTVSHITLNRSTNKWAAGSTTLASSNHTNTAAKIVFADGETLQEKYDNGTL